MHTRDEECAVERTVQTRALRSTVGIGLVAAACLALGATCAQAAPVSLPSTLGVYVGPSSPGSVAQFGSSIGGRPPYAMDFLDGSTWQGITNPSWPVPSWEGQGYQMIWGVPMIPTTGATMAAGAAGSYNQYFQLLAQHFIEEGQGSSIIRIGWEFNGDWFPWGTNDTTASQFVAFWQQIVNSMRSVPGSNFRFEWNPDRGGTVDLASYYPGDSYVDIIGMDVYDTQWASYPGASAEFSDIETQQYGLDWLNSFATQHGKPMSFPEWGLGWGPSSPKSGPVTVANTQVSGGDNPTFVSDMAAWIHTHNVLEATFWDYGTSAITGGSNPQTMASLGREFGHSPSTALPAILPESPIEIALPLLTLGLLGGAALRRRRRMPGHGSNT